LRNSDYANSVSKDFLKAERRGDRTAASRRAAVDRATRVFLGDSNAVHFTAGPNEEEDGLFGILNLQ